MISPTTRPATITIAAVNRRVHPSPSRRPRPPSPPLRSIPELFHPQVFGPFRKEHLRPVSTPRSSCGRPVGVAVKKIPGRDCGLPAGCGAAVDRSSRPKRPIALSLCLRKWSGQRDSNPRRPAWEADTLPTELCPLTGERTLPHGIRSLKTVQVFLGDSRHSWHGDCFEVPA